MSNTNIGHEKNGGIYASLAFLTWGLVPIFWKFLHGIDYHEVLSHRILWASLWMGLFVFYKKEFKLFFATIKNKKIFVSLLISTFLIMFNWNLYIWAVSAGHIVEGSLGYFLNPLLNVLIGVGFLKEKLKLAHWFAFFMALIGVSLLFYFQVGKPWISIGLALSFALYGLVRKLVPVKAYLGQFFETVFLLPFVLIHFLYLMKVGRFQFAETSSTIQMFLIGSGLVTALPLVWFSIAIRNLPLSIVGLFQYIAPTLQLMCGVFLYHEPFGKIHLISFGFIWVGLIVFTVDQLIKSRIAHAKNKI